MVRLKDPDGPTEKYPPLMLFQKLVKFYNAKGWTAADFVGSTAAAEWCDLLNLLRTVKEEPMLEGQNNPTQTLEHALQPIVNEMFKNGQEEGCRIWLDQSHPLQQAVVILLKAKVQLREDTIAACRP